MALAVAQLPPKSRRRRAQVPRGLRAHPRAAVVPTSIPSGLIPATVPTDPGQRRAEPVVGSPTPGCPKRHLPGTLSEDIDRLIAGEGAAYERLLREHGPRMLAVARRYLPRTHDAEDAVQDALLNVVRSIATFKRESRLETWLHRIVVNCALMRLRSQRRKPHITLDESTPRNAADSCRRRSTPLSPHSVVALEETHLALRTAIGRLPLRQRQILVLRDLNTLELKQVADILDIGISTAKVGLHRARRRLKCALASA